MSQAPAEACGAAMWGADEASPGLGMTLNEMAPGRATLSMAVREGALPVVAEFRGLPWTTGAKVLPDAA